MYGYAIIFLHLSHFYVDYGKLWVQKPHAVAICPENKEFSGAARHYRETAVMAQLSMINNEMRMRWRHMVCIEWQEYWHDLRPLRWEVSGLFHWPGWPASINVKVKKKWIRNEFQHTIEKLLGDWLIAHLNKYHGITKNIMAPADTSRNSVKI